MNPWALIACVYELFFTRYVEPEPTVAYYPDGERA